MGVTELVFQLNYVNGKIAPFWNDMVAIATAVTRTFSKFLTLQTTPY